MKSNQNNVMWCHRTVPTNNTSGKPSAGKE